MNNPESNQLKIINLDPMGQGVAKRDSHVFFIPKTLPDEVVEYKTRQEKSKITFAEVTRIVEASHLRTTPTCPHYDQCSGCHYLHTTYEQEINFKELSLAHYLKGITELPKINVSRAPHRFSYRNRMQLHYKKGVLGLHREKSHEILEVPNCQLPQPSIQKAIKELYLQKTNFQQGEGHIELFVDKNSHVRVERNKPYAADGFSQVNPAMNTVLQEKVRDLCAQTGLNRVLELFCGDGNLTRLFDKKTQVMGFDSSLSERVEGEKIYLQQDLYASEAVSQIQRECRKSHFKPEILLLDPPRSGYKQLKELNDAFNCEFIIYVSCAPDTLARDLKFLSPDYQVEQVDLLDLFPSTYHYETVVFLKKKS